MQAETHRLMYRDRLQRLLVAAWIAFYLLPVAGRFAGGVWTLVAVPFSWLGCLSVSLLLTRRASRSAGPVYTTFVALVFQCILIAAYFLVGAVLGNRFELTSGPTAFSDNEAGERRA
jgi:hypothetical protein